MESDNVERAVSMKIKIVNFGPIKEFEFDFSKKLIATYGDNNIGKSYAMQVVYLLFKRFFQLSKEMGIYSYHAEIHTSINNRVLEVSENLWDLIRGKNDEKECVYQLTDLVFDYLSLGMIPELLNSYSNTFANFDNILKKNPHIYICLPNCTMDFRLNDEKICGTIPDLTINIKEKNADIETTNYGSMELNLEKTYSMEDIKLEVVNKLGYVYANILFNIVYRVGQIFFLPASRSGIYNGMSAFGAIVAELAKNRSNITRKIEFPGITEPISDYFIELSNISNNKTNNILHDRKIKQCYDAIECNILNGEVIFDKETNELKYTPKEEKNVQYSMSEVSSMVSEVSPIVAFLKYIIANREGMSPENKAILFIEEPEAHLHPNNQVKLMEIFTELTNAGITLVMSSHSNYVFNKLNNLVLSGKLDYHIYQPIYLEKGAEGSISKPMHIDECGADDDNFIDVSEALYNEREQIIQEHNEDTE